MNKDVPAIEDFFDLSKTDYAEFYRNLQYPWELVKIIPDIVAENIKSKNRGKVSDDAIIGQGVRIAKGTVIEPGAVIKGPAIIGKNCEIRSGAYIRENVVIGNGVTIGHSTEVKRSIIHNEAEIPHFSYVGDSVIGWRGHLGAGVKVSNLKINRKPVVIHLDDGDLATDLRKFGCLLGDESEIGCNSVLNPGTLVGKRTLAMANISLSGYYPPDSFVKLTQDVKVSKRKGNKGD